MVRLELAQLLFEPTGHLAPLAPHLFIFEAHLTPRLFQLIDQHQARCRKALQRLHVGRPLHQHLHLCHSCSIRSLFL